MAVTAKTACFLAVALVVASSVPSSAKVWALKDTPRELRPKLCADLRKAYNYEVSTSSYKRALQRKKDGNMWRVHKARLKVVDDIRYVMRELRCGTTK